MPRSRYTSENLLEMHRLREAGMSYTKIAAKFGCHYSLIMYYCGHVKPHKSRPKRHLLKNGWSIPTPKKIEKGKFIPPPKPKMYEDYTKQAELVKEYRRDIHGNLIKVVKYRVLGAVDKNTCNG